MSLIPEVVKKNLLVLIYSKPTPKSNWSAGSLQLEGFCPFELSRSLRSILIHVAN